MNISNYIRSSISNRENVDIKPNIPTDLIGKVASHIFHSISISSEKIGIKASKIKQSKSNSSFSVSSFVEIARSNVSVPKAALPAAKAPTPYSIGVHVINSLPPLDTTSLIAKNNGLTSDEYHAIKMYINTNKEKWSSIHDSIVLRREDSGLSRTLVVDRQGEGPIKIYALLKQKGGVSALGEGAYKKATWALDMETDERMVFLSEKREKMGSSFRPLNDRERDALIKYAGRPGFIGGRVVTYRFKVKGNPPMPSSGSEKRGALVEPFRAGELSDYITTKKVRKKGPLTLSQIYQIGSDIALALSQLHADGEMHLDVKPRNIMLREENGVLRGGLGDFSFIHKVGELKESMGTPAYLSPEIFSSSDLSRVNQKADMWSFGMMLYDLKQGEAVLGATQLGYTKAIPYPTNGEAGLEIWKKIHLTERDREGSLDWLIDHCLVMDPSARFSSDQALQILRELASIKIV